jgi:hypothetical protein
VLEDHDVASNPVVGSSLLLGIDVESDDVAHGERNSFSGRQIGAALAGQLERPTGNECLFAAVLVHHHNGTVLLDGDDLRLKGEKMFHALGPLLSTISCALEPAALKNLKF